METTINVLDYLSDSEIKEIAQAEVRNKIRVYLGDEKNTKRVLSNLSYQIVFDEVDRNLGTSAKKTIADNVQNIIKKQSSYSVFRDKDNGYERSDSEATKIVRQTVKEQTEVIKQKVRDTIANKDFSEEIWIKFEQLGEDFTSNIYSLIEMVTKKS